MYEIPSKFVVRCAKNRTFASYMLTMPSMRLEKEEFGLSFSSRNWYGILKKPQSTYCMTHTSIGWVLNILHY